MDFDTQVKVAIYRITAESGRLPSLAAVAAAIDSTPAAVQEALRRLR